MSSSDGYRQVLRWAALPVTDRRWAAPLSAVALGFGLFVGVAIGPGATGTFATGAAQIIEIPGFGGGDSDDDGGEERDSSASAKAVDGGGGESSAPAAESLLPPIAPVASSEAEEASEATPPPPQAAPPAGKEPEPEEEKLAGIVVHVNPAAASYTIAEPEGTLEVIHAAKAPQPGAKLEVPVRLLTNGTFAEAGTRSKSGLGTRATFTGIVTYVDPTPTAPAYTVSKRGASVLVNVHPDPTGAPPTLPALGAFADVAVEIEKSQSSAAVSALPESAVPASEPPAPAVPGEPAPPSPASSEPPAVAPAPAAPAPTAEPPLPPAQPTCAPDSSQPPLSVVQPNAILWQRQVKAQGAPFTASDFAGIVTALCPATGQLLLSADDIRESQQDLVFTVPATIDTAKLTVGQSVAATATIGADGALSLTGLASDERTKGADDAKATQGALVGSPKKGRE
jgi:hypothetical protein